MRFRRSVAAAVVALGALSDGTAAAVVAPPFDLPAPVAGGGPADCAAAPAPVTSFAADSIYEEGDETHSTIDAEAARRYQEAVRPLREFSQELIRLANRYLRSGGRDTGSAGCVIAWLAEWANAGALLDLQTRQAALSLTRIMSAVALAYVEVRDVPGIRPEERKAIEAWLGRIGAAITATYSDSERHSDRGNHRYWGGLAAGAIAAATGDAGLLDWALASYRIGVCQAEGDGALPIELTRGKRARDYHIHAVAPLVMLAELGERNGRRSYDECDGALHRIVAYTLRAIDDPAAIEKRAGAKQLPLRQNSSRLAWLAVYGSRFPLPVAVELPESLGASTLGGNMDLLYGRAGE